jgi:hypothetical protein
MSTPEDEEVLDKRTDVSARRRLVIYGIVLVAVFLIGLVPMWLVARSRGAERDAAQHELRLCQLENSLASAALDARRGEYEHARQAASGFFTSLREQVDLVKVPSDLTSQQSEALRPILNQRDDLITLLARSDPASADRLAEAYTSYQKAMGTGH